MVCNMDCFNCTFDDCINDMSPRQIVMYRYNHSDKGKERLKKYEQSDKGKERQKRKQQKDIASGKNAERCKRYYQRKKARMLDRV